MPPRKKARLSSRPPSSASADTPKAISPKQAQIKDEDIDMHGDDTPWTDEQETALLSAIIKWKPVGMHKHFRMIAIDNYMRQCGFNEEHTQIPGIWIKLNQLYDLKTLDEREDAFTGFNGEADADIWAPFQLPRGEGYEEMMIKRRISKQKSSSPPTLSYQLSTEGASINGPHGPPKRASSTEESEDARSPPSSSRGGRGARRGRGGRGGRGRSRAQEESTPKVGKGKEESESEEEEEEDEDDEDEEEEEEADESEASTPAARGGRRGGRGGRSGRGRGRSRGRRGR